MQRFKNSVRRLFTLHFVAFAGLIGMPCLGADNVTIVQASGPQVTDVPLRQWTKNLINVGKDVQTEIPIDDVLSIQLPHPPIPLVGGEPLVLMANGDRLVLRPVGVFEDVLTATWLRNPLGAALKLPLETVSSIVFDLPAAMNDRLRLYADLQTLPAGDDVVLLTNGDRVQGNFERLDATQIHLKSKAGSLKIDRHRIRAIRMNPELTNSPRIAGRRLKLTLTDGSQMTVQSAELMGADLKCETLAKVELSIPVSMVMRCQVFGKRAVPLTDREPAQVQFTPYLSTQWPLIKNENVLRGPLTMRGAEFATGLGMHSRMQVTYSLTGKEREFRATVGIDDCANGSGSAQFAVELDGRRAWESIELTGRSPAIAVPPLKLTGTRQLTLIVDFGKNADVSDYADWCDAMLLLDD